MYEMEKCTKIIYNCAPFEINLKIILLMGGMLLTKPFLCCIFVDVNING